jgi:hypothetical protein
MRSLASRTFRWNDGTSTEGYDAVELDDAGLVWFRWSHRHGAGGRREAGRQTFAGFLEAGPLLTPPAHLLAELERIARARCDADSDA